VEIINNKSFYYPPGGILIWIIILVELVTFSAGIIAFSYQSHLYPEIFQSSKEALNVHIGFANTLILLTSGFFVAQSIRDLREGNSKRSQKLMWIAIGLGCLFLTLKGYEYFDKIEHGFGFTHDSFFMFYWMLTGFHFLHVLVGLVILIALTLQIRKGLYSQDNFLDVETGASFWHMCDLIWLILFPMLYLV
jgi:nitric oxide reductase NorE protein